MMWPQLTRYPLGYLKSSALVKPLLPEVSSLAKQVNVQCIYGEDEAPESGCPLFRGEEIKVKSLPGGHHFDASADQLYELIIK